MKTERNGRFTTPFPMKTRSLVLAGLVVSGNVLTRAPQPDIASGSLAVTVKEISYEGDLTL
jgi:hypothetical protein